MFYVGYFSWVGPKPEILTDHWPNGSFSCFVEADSVNEAGEKLQYLVADVKSWALLLQDVVHVHFDSIVEVKKLPELGILARIEDIDDERGRVFFTLPGVLPEFCRSYDYLSKDTDEEDEHGTTELPFISFDEEVKDPDPDSFRFS
jgi:hypothetical protein